MRCYAFPYIYRDIRLKSVVSNPWIQRPRTNPAHDPTACWDLTWPDAWRTLRSVYEYRMKRTNLNLELVCTGQQLPEISLRGRVEGLNGSQKRAKWVPGETRRNVYKYFHDYGVESRNPGPAPAGEAHANTSRESWFLKRYRSPFTDPGKNPPM